MSETTYPRLNVDQRVRFSEERLSYRVRGVTSNGRFAICVKPFNARRTVLYSVIDFEEGVRGTDNLVFSLGYESPEMVAESLAMFETGRMEVSHRTRIPVRFADNQLDPTTASMLFELRAAIQTAENRAAANRRRWQREHEAAMARRGALA